MLRDITNSPRYCNALESPPSSKSRRFHFPKKTLEDEITPIALEKRKIFESKKRDALQPNS